MDGDITMTYYGIDDALYLQIRIARKLMKRHNLTVEEFLKLDNEHDILNLLEIGYEPLHLTGDEGILDEIDSIIQTHQIVK